MKNIYALIIILSTITSCNSDKPGDINISSQSFNITGIKYSETSRSFDSTYNAFKRQLNNNDAISIIAEVDHQLNARNAGRVLNPTKIIFFGNPALGTPLMQRNQLAGLDLPQKVLFLEDDSKLVYALYNSVPYLESRYNLTGVETLDNISTALSTLVTNATGSEIKRANNLTVEENAGIVSLESSKSFDETYSALKSAITAIPQIVIVAELDHQANAASVGLELNPTKLIIFGNPELGSPLLQNAQTIGLDLPQKMLVWEDALGKVTVSYIDPFYTKTRYSFPDDTNNYFEDIDAALKSFAEQATGNTSAPSE